MAVTEGAEEASSSLEEALKRVTREARELYVGFTVCERVGPVEPLEFYRDFVSLSKPAIFRGAARNWPAVQKWTNDYLLDKLKGLEFSVAYTPNGRADAVSEDDSGNRYFCKPDTRSMTFADFLKSLEETKKSGKKEVPYIQLQNDSLHTEFGCLKGDVPPNGPTWAVTSFNCTPEAANVWIGDERSCTSFHKDHYENIFVVIAGEKEFHLLPPHEGFRLSSRTYRAATFKATEDRGAYEIRPDPDGAEVNWSSLDLDMQEEHQEEHFPHFASRSWPTPITCKVKEGDIMYLPPIWWHYVRQTVDKENRCIAVNFWYDMQFGPTTIASMFSDVLSKSLSPG